MRAAVCFAVALFSVANARAADSSPRAIADFSASGIEPERQPLTTQDRPLPEAAPARPLAGLSEHTPFAAVRRPHDLPLLGPERPLPASAPAGIHIGPFHAEAVTKYSRSGRARMVPQYRMDGLTVLGGDIGGSFDGRGGMVTLHWRLGP